MINRYWWDQSLDTHKICLVSRDRPCKGKLEEGVGSRDLEALNSALFARQLWRIINNELSPASRSCKAVYLPHCGLLEATLSPRQSYTWRSLWEVKWIIEEGNKMACR